MAAGTYPERIEDRTVCQYCDFKSICLPDEASDSITILENQDLLDLLEQREVLKESAKNYESIDKKIKDNYLESIEVGTHLVGGKFQIKITETQKAYYAVPDDLKEKYKELKPSYRTVITALK